MCFFCWLLPCTWTVPNRSKVKTTQKRNSSKFEIVRNSSMPLEPFQTVRGHRKKWHLNRSKPFDGGPLILADVGSYFVLFFYDVDIFWHLLTFFWELVTLSVLTFILWFFDDLDTSQTKPVQIKRQNHLAFWRRRCHRGNGFDPHVKILWEWWIWI